MRVSLPCGVIDQPAWFPSPSFCRACSSLSNKRLSAMTSSIPKPWAALYKTRRWERRSRLNLKMHKYLCQECLKNGKVEPATLSHHLNEWKPSSSELDFWYGPLTAVCRDCHFKIHGFNQSKEEFVRDIDESGWPCDPLHPVYNSTTAKRERQDG
jgi:hypothetical protein